MKKILLVLAIFFVSTANADILDDCLNQIVSKNEIWQDMLFNKTNGVFGFLNDTDELTDEIVQSNKEGVYKLLATNITSQCPSDIIFIAKRKGRGLIPFSHNNKEYAFDFDVQKIFDYTESKLGFMVINNKNLSRNNVFKVSDVPNGISFFNSSCSAQNARFNIPDDAAVNLAGQAVFTEFGGSSNEFYLDYAEGDNRRAFPGLVIMDKTKSAEEFLVVYNNLPVALERYEQFGQKLKNSACANQNLALYLVSLGAQKTSTTFSVFNWIHSILIPPTFYAVSPVIEKMDSVTIVEGPFPL